MSTERLQQDVADAKILPLYSEKAKLEAIIFPIICEIRLKNPQINVFSSYALTIEKHKELIGTPDFMIFAKPKTIVPQSPIFCLFESKNKDPEEGFAQGAAEMYAAHIFDQENNEPHETIYGAVTNAYDWVFMKIRGQYNLYRQRTLFFKRLNYHFGYFATYY